MVLDPLNDQVIDSIDISGGGQRLSSEQMILHNNKLFVTCWSYSDQVLVIDTRTDNIIDSIKVGRIVLIPEREVERLLSDFRPRVEIKSDER